MAAKERPFLVVTLRRTGATTFTTALSDLSCFPTIEHEPFNADRRLGYVTTQFQQNDNLRELYLEVEKALTDSPNIKHCIEIAPFELTAALLRTAAAKDYGIVVMTRLNEGARLVSLSLAKTTGAWGAEAAARHYSAIVEGRTQLPPILVKDLQNQATHDSAMLGRTLHLMKNDHIPYFWLDYEEAYGSLQAFQGCLDRVRDMLNTAKRQNAASLAATFGATAQESQRLLAHVPNVEEIRRFVVSMDVRRRPRLE